MSGAFNSFFVCFSGLADISLEVMFFGRFTGKKAAVLPGVLFIAPVCIAAMFPITGLLKLALFTSMLSLYGILVLKAGTGAAVLHAVLTVEIMQLCYGIFNSITMVLASLLFDLAPLTFGRIFFAAGSLLPPGMAYLCYQAVWRHSGHKENIQKQYVLIIAAPLLAILVTGAYINHIFYGNTVSFNQDILIGSHMHMLIIQALGIASIFSVIYACRKLSAAFSTDKRLALTEQQSHLQKQYAEEARAHYDQARSLRHDLKNHVLVLKGLLEKTDLAQAKAYLEQMEAVTASLSFPFSTNNPVLDILLENKAALAKATGITVSSTLKVPYPCTVDDMDFCIILSNALDNAINACEKLGPDEKKYIHISCRRQEDFLLIEIENSFDGNRRLRQGTGMSNIRRAAEKYGGAMEASTEGKVFSLSTLLVISRYSEP